MFSCGLTCYVSWERKASDYLSFEKARCWYCSFSTKIGIAPVSPMWCSSDQRWLSIFLSECVYVCFKLWTVCPWSVLRTLTPAYSEVNWSADKKKKKWSSEKKKALVCVLCPMSPLPLSFFRPYCGCILTLWGFQGIKVFFLASQKPLCCLLCTIGKGGRLIWLICMHFFF